MSEADSGQEFVTIAEAAQKLGISERQARRDAGRLPDNDRRMSGKGAARVRLAALAGLRGQPLHEENGVSEVSGDDRPMPDNAGHVSGAGEGTLIEQLREQIAREREDRSAEAARHRAEVERLNLALERSQTLQLQTLGALTTEQQRARELETQAAKLIAALPSADPASNTPQETPQGDSTGDRAEGGHSQTPGAAEEKKRGFFARWFGRKKEA